MDDKGDEHKCNICNKLYSSYKTLWKHTKNIHKTNVDKKLIKFDERLIKTELNESILNYNCRFCNKYYNNKNSRWSHEQKCKIIFDEKEHEKQNTEIKLAEINKEIKLAEIKIAEINKEVELAKINSNEKIELAKINKEIELKKLEIKKENTIIKQKANSNPTIKNINKLLRAQNKIKMTNSNLTSNSNNTNNIQNNIVHNHFKIEGFGKENILDTITEKEKKLILNQGCESIEKLVEIIYTGKYDQYKNIIVTNKRDNNISIFDDTVGVFINNDKNLVLNKLISNRLENIEEIYNEFDENNKLSDNNRKILSRFFIKFIDEDKKYIDENSNNKEYKNYIEYKVNKINNILFNYQDKIIQDVTSAIENKK